MADITPNYEKEKEILEERQNKTSEPPPTKKHHSWIIVLIVIALIIGTILIVRKCNATNDPNNPNTSQPTLLTRQANNNDIIVNTSNDFSLGFNYKVIPQSDINGLELTFKYYTFDKVYIVEKTKYLGNVTKGTQYDVSFSITDFNFTEVLAISYSTTTITKGTVSYFK